MNSGSNISSASGPGSNSSAGKALADMDATLSLIAKMRAPAGLADRVFAGVLARPRKGRVIEWPRPLYERDWLRGIAAAALVLAVGGGGWGIYAHVEPNEPARAIAAPPRMIEQGGFSSADVVRRPQTIHGPVVKKEQPAAKAKTVTVEPVKAVHGRKGAKAAGARRAK